VKEGIFMIFQSNPTKKKREKKSLGLSLGLLG
jgi:hypothetical protein